jgi:hypothetical protein
MVLINDILGVIIIMVLLYLGYFVFDIDGKNKGKKQPNILEPIITSLKKLAGWVNRQ